jgi:hypothetical protein
VRRLRDTLGQTSTLARAVPARQWLRVVALAAVNWLTDLACLLAALHAVGLAVPARTVATAYLAAQLIRQIPVTPGGIGVIEASLILALTTAGAAPAPAAAAVLIYRLLSCWTILPIGLVCWTAQKTPPLLTEPQQAFAVPTHPQRDFSSVSYSYERSLLTTEPIVDNVGSDKGEPSSPAETTPSTHDTGSNHERDDTEPGQHRPHRRRTRRGIDRVGRRADTDRHRA